MPRPLRRAPVLQDFKNLTKPARPPWPAFFRTAELAYPKGKRYLCTHTNKHAKSYEPDEQANPAARHTEHHLQHHHSAAGNGRYGHRRPTGQRCRRDRRHRYRDDDLQHDLLDLRLPAHGDERRHGTGLRRPRPEGVHPHPGPLDVRSRGTGPAARRAAQSPGAILAGAAKGRRHSPRSTSSPASGPPRPPSPSSPSTAGSSACRTPAHRWSSPSSPMW